MNDWNRIGASLRSDDSRAPATIAQIWRSTELARVWFDAKQIDIRTVTSGDIARFVSEVPPTSGPKSPTQRKSFINAVVTAAQAISTPSGRAGSMAARLDDVGDKSPLGKAVAQVLASAHSEGDRRRFKTCLGAFLKWCDTRGVPPKDCWPGDLAIYKRCRLAAGYRSPGEYMRVARRLLDALAPR